MHNNLAEMQSSSGLLLQPEKNDGGPKTVNIFLGFFLMINLVVGTGFLGIPYAFASGGVLAGSLTLICVTTISWMCAIFVVETMARCQALEDYEKRNGMNINNEGIPEFRIVTSRKFEPSEQCQILSKFNKSEYMGYGAKVIYLLSLSAIIFSACIAYCTVAGPAWAVNLPLHFGAMEQCESADFAGVTIPHGGCHWSYRFCVFLFACIVVPLTLCDLREQVIVQFILGVLRFATVGAIILYCLVHIAKGELLTSSCHDESNSSYVNNSSNEINHTNDTLDVKELFLEYSFKGWLITIPVFVYAHILHLAIPSLTHPIKEKRFLRGYFNIMFLVIGLLYLSLGLFVSFAFRDCTQETCTLNWGYTAQKHHNHHHPNKTPLRIISYIIVLFPSFDVCSAFPLVVHTMVNNIYSVIFGRDTSQDTTLKWLIVQRSMKFIAAILPIMIAMFVSNLVTVLNYSGMLAFLMAFFFPIYLQLRSQWVCRKTFRYLLSIKKHNDFTKETTPLLSGVEESNFARDLLEFLFTTRNSNLYYTPYSMFFSYPIFEIPIAIIAFCTLTFTIASLAY